MAKKILSLVLVLFMIFTIGICAFADEEPTGGSGDSAPAPAPAGDPAPSGGGDSVPGPMPVAPSQPDVSNMPAAEANPIIDNYNEQVDNYNAAAEAYNNEVDKEYNEAVEQVQEHNAAEDAKVATNEAAIAKKESYDKRVAENDAQTVDAGRVDNLEDLPDTFEVNTTAEEAHTISVQEAEEKSGITYKTTALHMYTDGSDETQVFTPIQLNEDGTYDIPPQYVGHIIRTEWETIECDANDLVTVQGEGSADFGKVAFVRYLPTNYGQWVPTTTVSSEPANFDDFYTDPTVPIDGYRWSYNEGTNHPGINFVEDMLAFFLYGPIINYKAPAEVEKYEPSYMDDPVKGEYAEKAEHMEHKTDPAPKPNPSHDDPAPHYNPEPVYYNLIVDIEDEKVPLGRGKLKIYITEEIEKYFNIYVNDELRDIHVGDPIWLDSEDKVEFSPKERDEMFVLFGDQGLLYFLTNKDFKFLMPEENVHVMRLEDFMASGELDF